MTDDDPREDPPIKSSFTHQELDHIRRRANHAARSEHLNGDWARDYRILRDAAQNLLERWERTKVDEEDFFD